VFWFQEEMLILKIFPGSIDPKALSMLSKGNLYLIPSPIGNFPVSRIMPLENIQLLARIRIFIVEEVKTARRFISSTGIDLKEHPKEFLEFNEHSDKMDVTAYLDAALAGSDIAILSEAGLPCIADPGSLIVAKAHQLGIRVIPLTGPSSIFLALMASGFNGQKFLFHGYLPIEKGERARFVREIERQSRKDNLTQIFIETPYRNKQMLEVLLKSCNDETRLCIALDLNSTDENIVSKPIRQWKSGKNIEMNKKPAVFLLYAGD
jgi:16S rRNA (cytidine1402-2'-O)-methyltransferase